MANKDEKKHSPQDVARAVLAKCEELYKNSKLAKANTSHELEAGGEPNNDDAEAPEELQAGEVCKENSFSDTEKKGQKKKKMGEGGSESSEEGGDSDAPAHEEGMSSEEESDHDAKENQDDEKDEDNIEADEEPESKAADKKIESKKEDKGEKKEDSEEGESKEKPKDKKAPFQKSLFNDQMVKLDSESKRTKDHCFWEIKYCIENLKNMKELSWTVESEAPEAKNVFDKQFEKEKGKLSKLVKEYSSLKKSESNDEFDSLIKKAERILNNKPSSLKEFVKQRQNKNKTEKVEKLLGIGGTPEQSQNTLPNLSKDK